MGRVYRATDTRLKRPVAVKVLAEEIASAEARRRFQREAQAASSLNHPHILTVYDAGEFQERQYLVRRLPKPRQSASTRECFPPGCDGNRNAQTVPTSHNCDLGLIAN
jgi:serine/threonine protein kinase